MSFSIEIDYVNEKNRSIQKIPQADVPEFAEYSPDIDAIKDAVADYQNYENIIIVGNGGSITSFRAYLYSFLPEVKKDIRIVTTVDPDYLHRLSRELGPENTLVVPISKSGETVTVIESLMYFIKRDYDVFGVTSDNDGALKQILEERDYDWVEHPDIGGRFSGLTETGLVPAALAGMDIEEMREGAEEMYEKVSPKEMYNPALNLAAAFLDAEQKGFEQIFAGFYATRLFGFYPLFVQLMHETVSKEGKGQTIFGDIGPEFQHHTNQRIFGGRRNILPVFFKLQKHEHEELDIPGELESVDIRNRKLGDFDGMDMTESLDSEYYGVKEALADEEMPNITLTLKDLDYRGVGKLVAYLQYVAVYSAWLREVDPFNQPDVEKSKRKGFEARFENRM